MMQTFRVLPKCVWAGSLLTLLCIAWCSKHCSAQSAVDRLSGFDLGRIAALSSWCEKPFPDASAPASEDEVKAGNEVAKFLYQVKRFSRGGLNADGIPPISDPTLDVGYLAKVRGEVTELQSWSIPAEMAESLDMTTLYRVTLKTEEGRQCIVMTCAVPQAWLKKSDQADNQPLHPTNGSGVVIRAASELRPAILATSTLAWMISKDEQDTAAPTDWKFLSDKGLDLTALETVRQLDRQPLQSEDNGPFYSLMRIAADINDASSAEPLPLVPKTEPPVNLLKQSKQWVGRYIHMNLQTVRLTRVRITDEATKSKVGSDSYWQLDCIGDLGNVVVKIDSGTKDPAVFENRYPVSVVVRDLPEFLKQQAQSGNAVQDTKPLLADQIDTAMVSTQIAVDGFYYRLWSYESRFMDQHGGGEQFGPLLIAARVLNNEPPHTDVLGVSRIAWFVTIIASLVILAAIIGSWLSAKGDAAAKRRNMEPQPDQLPKL